MPNKDISFHIDAYTPETLPLARLAEYLGLLASLYGHKESVHFQSIESGSAVLKSYVEEPDYQKVVNRIQLIHSNDGPKDLAKTFHQIDDCLRQDNATGKIQYGENVIEFPGRNRRIEEPVTITQIMEIDGVIIKIGGKDETIPVTIKDQEGKIYNCQINGNDRAKELSRHYLGKTLRLVGEAKLVRHPVDGWSLHSLIIEDYEPIDDDPLSDVFGKISAIEGIGWKKIPDPLEEWRSLRGE